MILIDTDILTLLFFGNPKVTERWLAAPVNDVITVITRVETLLGRLRPLTTEATPANILKNQERLRETEAFLSRFRVILLDNVAVAQFENLRGTKSCRSLGIPDLLNAAIALTLDATLITRNVKDYEKVPGLKLENWAD